MYDTARRVAFVKQRVRENNRRRQRARSSGRGNRKHGACSARCCCGNVLVAVVSFAAAAAITALCFRLKNRENQKKGGADKPAPQEQEEKSQ